MKKIATFLMLILLLATVAMITGCGGGEQDEALVGTWAWDLEASYIYVFNEDGTGERGFPGHMTAFTWNTNGSRLNFTFPGSSENYARRWTYTISGNILTLDSQQTDEIYSYIRVD